MLDFDLAELYEVETRVMNQAVKRNNSRFPADFMFRLLPEEWEFMSSQIVMTSRQKRPKKAIPYAFTEHGVTMLACILRSEKAIKMNIAIVRVFIALRQLAIQHKDLSAQVNQLRKEMYEKFGDHDTQLEAIYTAIEKMLKQKEAQKISWEERERIGFKKD